MEERELTNLLRERLRLDAEGRLVGKDDRVLVVERNGDEYVVRTGEKEGRIFVAALQRLLGPAYAPPKAPELKELPEPGPVPPGSRLLWLRDEYFTGREKPLRELARYLLHEQPSRKKILFLSGEEGIGKTALAAEFAHRYGRFFSGVHWLNAAYPAAVPAEVAACGEAMQPAGWPAAQEEQVRRTLQEWQKPGRRLVVLDGLSGFEAAGEWLSKLSRVSCLLVTTRQDKWPAELGPVVLVEPFSVEESMAYLSKLLPQDLAGRLELLGERLERLPLSLELAAHSAGSAPDYLQRLGPLLAGRQEEIEGVSSPSLAAALQLSWAQLDEESRRVLLLAGYLAPGSPIPVELLRYALPASPVFLDTTGVEHEETPPVEVERAARTLSERGLLQLAEKQAEFMIHPAVVSLTRVQEERDDLLPNVVAALLARIQEAQETQLPAQVIALYPHIEAVAGVAEQNDPEQARGLWDGLGAYLHATGDDAGAQAALERAVKAAELSSGPDKPQLLTTELRELGNLLRARGDLGAARDVLERAVATTEEVWPAALNDLGEVLYALGDRAGARDALERGLAEFSLEEGNYSDPALPALLRNRARLLREEGDLPGARRLLERALDEDEGLLGDEDIAVAHDLDILGGVLQDEGEVDAAREAYQRALIIGENTLGPQHPEMAVRLNNLGLVLHDQGELQEARTALERALAIDERTYGPDHPEVAVDVNNLGSVLQDMDDLEGAREAYARALAIDEKAFGPDHPNVAVDVNNLGQVLYALGELKEARAAHERALTIDEKALGASHPDVASDLAHLGLVLRDLGERQVARLALQRALEIYRRVLPRGDRKIQEVEEDLKSIR